MGFVRHHYCTSGPSCGQSWTFPGFLKQMYSEIPLEEI